MNNNQLLKKLEKYPTIKSKFIELIEFLEKENLKLADEAEMTVKNTIDGMGKNLLETWAKNQEKIESKKTGEKGLPKHRKKNFIGIPPMGK